MQEIAGVEPPSDPLKSPANPDQTDPEFPHFDYAYANPEALQEIGVDGVMFEESAVKTWKVTGSRKRKRREIDGIYARIYVLDRHGEYRTIASVDWYKDRQVALELEDQARDLAERLGVPFQVLS
jgi:hypothetical protein